MKCIAECTLMSGESACFTKLYDSTWHLQNLYTCGATTNMTGWTTHTVVESNDTGDDFSYLLACTVHSN